MEETWTESAVIPQPSSPARAIESTPRFQRVMELAKSAGMQVGWSDYCAAWIVRDGGSKRVCRDVAAIEELVARSATVLHKQGIAAGEALAKWRKWR